MTLHGWESRPPAELLAALRLQLDWGVDEALLPAPVDRTVPAPPARAPAPAVARLPAPAARLPGPAATARLSDPVVRAEPAPAPPPPRPARPAAIPPGTPQAQAREAAAAARTIPELRAALAAFEACPLAATAGSLVFSDGNPDAGLVLVGEAPGAEEDRAGRPFAGPEGQLLDRMLASIGLDRTRLLMTTLIPWRPPGNRTPTEAEVQTCLPFLHRHLALLRPRRVVLLGALAARALTGSTLGIRRQRGRWTTVTVPGLDTPIDALPMLNPGTLLRTPASKREAWADLLALRLAMNSITER